MKRLCFFSIIVSLATTTAVHAQETDLAGPTIVLPGTTILPEATQIPIRDQIIEDFNNLAPFRTCADIACTERTDFDIAGVCYETNRYSVGVGIYLNAVHTSDTNLTLTLVNGAVEAANWESSREDENADEDSDSTRNNPENVRHELYVGAPANFDLQEADPGCALMLLAHEQPFSFRAFPGLNANLNWTEFQNEAGAIVNNTSWCPWGQPYSSIVNYTREFQYGANSSLPRCQAFAGYVNERIREERPSFDQLHWGSGQPTPLRVIGGAISGPDVPRDPRGPVNSRNPESPEIGSEDCQPVLPESYNLYNVSFADMPLYLGGDYVPGLYEGRNGTTLVYTAIYGEGEDSDPDVQYLCMQMRNPLGEELPGQQFLQPQDSSGRSLRGSVALYAVAAAAIFTALALQI